MNTGPIISLWCIQAEMFTDIKRTCHMTIKGKKYEAFIYLDRCWLSKKLLRCPSLSCGDSENVQRHKAMISASKKQTLKWLSNQIISPRFKNKNSNKPVKVSEKDLIFCGKSSINVFTFKETLTNKKSHKTVYVKEFPFESKCRTV